MTEPLDVLEARIDQLRRAIRDALGDGDAERATELRAQLRRTERAWDALVGTSHPDTPAARIEPAPLTASTRHASMLPAREHVHRALMLLRVPAAPKLIVNIHEAFFPGELSAAKLSSLRRDEERSYRAAPGARPYYLVPALTHDLLSPVRALISVSTWPLEQRVIGPLSPRVDFLTSAACIAEAVQAADQYGESGSTSAALQLLWRFAANIPGATPTGHATHGAVDPQQVLEAAHAELRLHTDDDHLTRTEAARRARIQLSETQQLFGAPLGGVAATAEA